MDPFARHLIETLLSYSSGRQMEAADQFEINDILQRVKSEQYGFRTLVTEVLVSRIFRSR